MFRKRLVDFYRRHNPDCLDSVEDILQIFKGREEELFRVLEEKYAGVDSDHLPSKVSTLQSNRQNLPSRQPAEDVVQALSYPDEESRVVDVEAPTSSQPTLRSSRAHDAFYLSTVEAGVGVSPQERAAESAALAGEVRGRHESNECVHLREENSKLTAAHHALRCNVVILEAEKEALLRQKWDDEETMEKLRARIAQHDTTERELLDEVCGSELRGKSVLSEDEFAAIIRSSQERLRGYYEDRIAFMKSEMETYYKHAAERMKEKDAIIAALKELLSHA